MKSAWLLMIPCIALGAACTTPKAEVETMDEALERTQEVLDELVREEDVPGVAYTVVNANEVILERTVGQVDAGTAVTMTPQTWFMAYSITKAITAIVVMRLVERGQMQLDAPLSRYFREHPYGDEVTIRMLLAHTAGISDPMPLDWFEVPGDEVSSASALQAVIEGDDLAETPGAEYAYSNVGYWLLEQAIEAATGLDFGEVVRAEVFEPLGVEDAASFELPIKGLATGHSRRWGWQTPVFWLMTPGRYWGDSANGWSRFAQLVPHGRAYGGLYVKPAALGAVLQDLLCTPSTLLSAKSLTTLFETQRDASGEAVGALGWVIGEVGGVGYFGKEGGGIGFHGNIRVYPEIGLGTVLMANATRVSPGPINASSDQLDAPFVRVLAKARRAESRGAPEGQSRSEE